MTATQTFNGVVPHAEPVTLTAESVPAPTKPAFYWSIVTAPGIKRAGVAPAGVLLQAAEDFPVPADSVHAVCRPTGTGDGGGGGGEVIVVAAERDALAALSGTIDRLAPEGFPECIGDAATFGPQELNLLIGEFEPPALRAARIKRHTLRAVVVVAVCILAAIGLFRSSRAWEENALTNTNAAMALLRDTVQGTRDADMANAVTALRDASLAAGKLHQARDASESLAALLAAWPTKLPSKPQSISVTESGISISVLVEGDPTPFIQALHAPPGWKLEEPRLNSIPASGSTPATTRLSLEMRSVVPPPPAGGRPR